MAITDHGAMYGAIDFYKGAERARAQADHRCRGLRRSRFAPFPRARRQPAVPHGAPRRNYTGYRNLVKLVTAANLEGYYYKPRMDRELFEQHNEGITALSGCPSSEFFRRLMEGDREGAVEVAKWYREVFNGHYYLEVQDHSDERFSRYNSQIAEIGRELDIPVVATNDSHFTLPEEHDAHDVLLCIGTNATVDQQDRFRIDGEGFYVRSEEEMRALFPDNPEFIDNTQLIADSCDLELPFDRLLLPKPPVPEGRESDEYLREICEAGVRERYDEATPELLERLHYELDVLKQTGFTDYIYIVKEIADYARERDIRMGVRGSAAASLVLYALRVTDIDPIANRLVFERFLNIERREMPDVDFDFADDRREEMIEFAYNYYGHDRVAQIITFGTLGAKAAIRDVGRALGISFADTDRVARLVPNQVHITLDEAIEQVPDLKAMQDNDPRIARLLQTARQLEGVSRHASTHAAALVISRDPLTEHVPLQRPSKGDETSIPTTQFAMDQVASIGLLKMDFLGLSNLTILGRAVDLIRETTGNDLDLLSIPDGDPRTMEMLGKGETFGVFQLESAGMRRYIQELQPTNIADLCAMVALYRPGPMQHIPRYIDGKHGRVEITYPHQGIADILDETYGVIVYQDQVLLIARKFAGYSLGQADIMRKAMGKKKAEIMAKERERFIEGAIDQGYTQEDATAVFELVEPFAGYAFNKAHSWCYGNIAYQTAYLKANYPAQYMTAVLQLTENAPDTYARIAAAVAECSRLGIEVLPPDVNESDLDFNVVSREDGSLAIRFGLGVVKNVGHAGVQGIIAAREKDGPFRDVEDFCKRADLSSANSRSIEHLAMAGALDRLGYDRGTLVMNAERLISLAKRERELRESGQATMFDLFGDQAETPMPALDLPPSPVSDEQMLTWEKELLGVYVSEHPFRTAAPEVMKYASHALSDLGAELVGQHVTVAGMVTRTQVRNTRDGRRFFVVELEDLSGAAEVTVWNDTIELSGEEMWAEGRVLVATVECRERNDRISVSVRKAAPFDRAEGTVVGFSPAQFAVEEAPKRGAKPANGGYRNGNGNANGKGAASPSAGGRPSNGYSNGQNGNGAHAASNGSGATNGSNGNGASHAQPATAPAAAPQGPTRRLVVTLYETENEKADLAVLRTITGMLAEHPGQVPVRLVIHDAGGVESEFELPGGASRGPRHASTITRVHRRSAAAWPSPPATLRLASS
ncbi:MAG: DNA polymerase III subunit alpha [Dehalococcoidia bacterium]|nr:DNA polymerase III subunit alpha [Dehalococcoidia bacterium]